MCHRANVVAPKATVDVAHLAFRSVSAPLVSGILSNDALRLIAQLSELQINYDRLTSQLKTIYSNYGSWFSLVRKRGDETINLLDSLDLSKVGFKLAGSEIAVIY